MKKRRLIASCIVILIFISCILTRLNVKHQLSFALPETITYQVGENVTAVFSEQTLVLTGFGDTYDYSIANPSPVSEVKDLVSKVVIDEGITGIGDYFFYDFSLLQGSLVLPQSLLNVGNYAFSGKSFDTAPHFSSIENQFVSQTVQIEVEIEETSSSLDEKLSRTLVSENQFSKNVLVQNNNDRLRRCINSNNESTDKSRGNATRLASNMSQTTKINMSLGDAPILLCEGNIGNENESSAFESKEFMKRLNDNETGVLGYETKETSTKDNAVESKENDIKCNEEESNKNDSKASEVELKANEQKGNEAGSKENEPNGDEAGSKENQPKGDEVGSKENQPKGDEVGSKKNDAKGSGVGLKENETKSSDTSSDENEKTESGKESKENETKTNEVESKENGINESLEESKEHESEFYEEESIEHESENVDEESGEIESNAIEESKQIEIINVEYSEQNVGNDIFYPGQVGSFSVADYENQSFIAACRNAGYGMCLGIQNTFFITTNNEEIQTNCVLTEYGIVLPTLEQLGIEIPVGNEYTEYSFEGYLGNDGNTYQAMSYATETTYLINVAKKYKAYELQTLKAQIDADTELSILGNFPIGASLSVEGSVKNFLVQNGENVEENEFEDRNVIEENKIEENNNIEEINLVENNSDGNYIEEVGLEKSIQFSYCVTVLGEPVEQDGVYDAKLTNTCYSTEKYVEVFLDNNPTGNFVRTLSLSEEKNLVEISFSIPIQGEMDVYIYEKKQLQTQTEAMAICSGVILDDFLTVLERNNYKTELNQDITRSDTWKDGSNTENENHLKNTIENADTTENGMEKTIENADATENGMEKTIENADTTENDLKKTIKNDNYFDRTTEFDVELERMLADYSDDVKTSIYGQLVFHDYVTVQSKKISLQEECKLSFSIKDGYCYPIEIKVYDQKGLLLNQRLEEEECCILPKELLKEGLVLLVQATKEDVNPVEVSVNSASGNFYRFIEKGTTYSSDISTWDRKGFTVRFDFEHALYKEEIFETSEKGFCLDAFKLSIQGGKLPDQTRITMLVNEVEGTFYTYQYHGEREIFIKDIAPDLKAEGLSSLQFNFDFILTGCYPIATQTQVSLLCGEALDTNQASIQIAEYERNGLSISVHTEGSVPGLSQELLDEGKTVVTIQKNSKSSYENPYLVVCCYEDEKLEKPAMFPEKASATNGGGGQAQKNANYFVIPNTARATEIISISHLTGFNGLRAGTQYYFVAYTAEENPTQIFAQSLLSVASNVVSLKTAPSVDYGVTISGLESGTVLYPGDVLKKSSIEYVVQNQAAGQHYQIGAKLERMSAASPSGFENVKENLLGGVIPITTGSGLTTGALSNIKYYLPGDLEEGTYRIVVQMRDDNQNVCAESVLYFVISVD